MSSNKPIAKGDLVMIVRPTPCCRTYLPGTGVPWRVGDIFRRITHLCDLCMTVQVIDLVTSDEPTGDGRHMAGTPGMLIKIDPPATDDAIEEKVLGQQPVVTA